MKAALLLAAALLAADPALAVLPTAQARDAGRRFGRASRVLAQSTITDALKKTAVERFNSRHAGGADRLGAAGLGGAALGPADVNAAATGFLSETQAALGIDPQQLEMLKTTAGRGGHKHVLYREVYKGLPVEFSSVKVHFDGSGKVLDVDSNFRRGIDLDVRPDVAASVAAYTVKKDLGEDVRSKSRLVVVLDPQNARPRLAWKFEADRNGRWIYYVDAHTGELILRYDDRRYVCGAGDAQGRIRAEIYPYDQQHGSITAVDMPHEWVYLKDANTVAETDASGQYCFQGKTGKVFTFLQGPYVRVGNFRGISAHFDNGAGTWSTALAGGIASPSPYPNDASLTQTVDVRQTNPTVVALAPIFNSFAVGTVSNGLGAEAADITDDDQVSILDSSGMPVSFYVGTRAAFTGAPVPGGRYSILLKSNSGGQGNGYSIANSSGLVIPTPAGNGTGSSGMTGPGGGSNGSFDWTSTMTATGLRAEFALFYHLNAMHDYFVNGPDASGAASLNPVAAMASLGPNIVNAFYDPEYDDFAFGDHSDSVPDDIFTDDATVPHHEYTHFVVQKIWNIQNFGEAGAISEGIADYFSASSLAGGQATANSSSIGKATNESLGNTGPLRELDDNTKGPIIKLGSVGGSCGANCTVQPWSGEIHTDSLYVSQALWDLRRDRIGALGAGVGDKCVDELTFQALLFFPESFGELANALIQADKIGAATHCGGAGTVTASKITTIFGNHGIPAGAVSIDPYDTASAHDDGFESAVDISTLGSVAATIYPASDMDFYTFASGPGQVEVTLDLPQEGAYYSGYMLTLYDRSHNIVAQQQADYNGINTNFGYCTQTDCTTTDPKIVLKYQNPTGGQLFVQVSGGPTDQGGSNSGVNNSAPYVLSVGYPRPYSLNAGIVSAQLDKDKIDFSILVTTWTSMQDYRFTYAQLRDQSQRLLPDTDAPAQSAGTKYLAWVSSYNALGQITGTVQLANGFNTRFPAVGTVYLEVFGYNVSGSTVSLGLSNPLNLTTNVSDVRAWNNVFNPNAGQKTTVRYDIQSPGHLTMKLYTLTGTLVQTLFDGDAPAGKGSVDWAGQNASGFTVASGIYLLHIQGPGVSKTQKIAVIK